MRIHTWSGARYRAGGPDRFEIVGRIRDNRQLCVGLVACAGAGVCGGRRVGADRADTAARVEARECGCGGIPTGAGAMVRTVT